MNKIEHNNNEDTANNTELAEKSLWEVLWEFIEICKQIKLKEPEEKVNI